MKAALIGILLGALLAGNAVATDLTISWTNPTQNEDNSAITKLTANNIYQGTKADGSDLKYIKQIAPAASYVVTGLAPGTYCFAITAVTTAESDKSNVACRTVVAPKPKAPTNLTIADSTAYVIKQTKDNLALVAVGSVPADTQCNSDIGAIVGGMTYYVVPKDRVSWAGSVRSEIVLAACAG